MSKPDILIFAPQYTHRSAGVRALYRLCEMLNEVGVRTAIAPMHPFDAQPVQGIPIHTGSGEGCVAIYSEVTQGNPLRSPIVVRWAMNYPGLLGGDGKFEPEDIVFVYSDIMRERTAKIIDAAPEKIATLFVPVLDPKYIFRDDRVTRDLSFVFTSHGRALRAKYDMPNASGLRIIEDEVTSMWHLGEFLRRCDTLYSYDHGSILLKEAIISGCKVLVMHEDGELRDPRTCGCQYNADWGDGFEDNYKEKFTDLSLVSPLLNALDARFPDWR